MRWMNRRNSVRIRNMEMDDVETVDAIQRAAYRGVTLDSKEMIARHLESSPSTSWVAGPDGRVVAYLIGFWTEPGVIQQPEREYLLVEHRSCFYIHDIALLPEVQGRGIGHKLVMHAIAHAKSEGCRAMALVSVQGSRRFWERYGFAVMDDLDDEQRAAVHSYCADGGEAYYMVRA
jgi:ribosomal protein S18 acetylase RimI-like enzyme